MCVPCQGAKIQLLDLPGIIEGAKDGKGRGRQVIAVARTCSLIFIVLDVLKPLQHKRMIEHELEGFGIRLNKEPPQITLRRKDKGTFLCKVIRTNRVLAKDRLIILNVCSIIDDIFLAGLTENCDLFYKSTCSTSLVRRFTKLYLQVMYYLL